MYITTIYLHEYTYKIGLLVDVKEVICGDPECAPIDTMVTIGIYVYECIHIFLRIYLCIYT
jgi:hypothetical protein